MTLWLLMRPSMDLRCCMFRQRIQRMSLDWSGLFQMRCSLVCFSFSFSTCDSVQISLMIGRQRVNDGGGFSCLLSPCITELGSNSQLIKFGCLPFSSMLIGLPLNIASSSSRIGLSSIIQFSSLLFLTCSYPSYLFSCSYYYAPLNYSFCSSFNGSCSQQFSLFFIILALLPCCED